MQYEAEGVSGRGLCRHGRSQSGCYRGEYARPPLTLARLTRFRRRERCRPPQTVRTLIPRRLASQMRRARTRRRHGTEEGVAQGSS